MLVKLYLKMVKCYTVPHYMHLIWDINIWKVPNCWYRHFWHLWLVKVKVTIQSFLVHLSRSAYFVTYVATFKYWCSHNAKFFKKEGLDRISVLRSQDLRRWLLGETGVTFFGEGGGACSFCIKNKLKSEIFNDKN